MKSWRIEIKPSAEKKYLKLDKNTRHRLKRALLALEKEENPFPHPRVRPLTGELKGDYRIRVGDWRAIFTPDNEKKALYVYAILPRGNAY